MENTIKVLRRYIYDIDILNIRILSTDIWERPERRLANIDGKTQLRFEIPYARVMPPENENSTIKKYIVYDLSVCQVFDNNQDPHPVTVERRYTNFLTLYDGLRQNHSSLLQTINFPKKVLMGNFSSQLIAERSATFEAFLDHIVSLPVLRDTTHFLHFLQGFELSSACQLLDERRNEQAVPILENCFRLLNKVCSFIYINLIIINLILLSDLYGSIKSCAASSLSPGGCMHNISSFTSFCRAVGRACSTSLRECL